VTNRYLAISATDYKKPSTRGIMLLVLLALLPGLLTYAFFISPLILINVVFAVAVALAFEALAVTLSRKNVAHTISDGSIALAAALLALSVPPMIPFWQLLVGVLIMVMLGKHVYGGLGHNVFNPAMVGYAALMVSFPQSMTLWFNHEALSAISLGRLIDAKLGLSILSSSLTNWDAITQATPLEHLRTQALQNQTVTNSIASNLNEQSNWLWVNGAFLIGGLFLLFKRIIQWQIPFGVLTSLAVLTLLFSNSPMPTHLSLLSGAAIVGAFFIATDPVTTASSHAGRLIFGIGVGVITFIIREYGGYPEGFAFAILLMNMCVPLIDHIELSWQQRQ